MDKSSKDFTNFGFTSSDEENDELKSPKKNRDDKPFRLQINVNDKKYGKRKLKETEKSDSKEVPSDVESEVSDPSDLESHSGEIKLFEDYSTRDENKFEEPRIIKNKRKLKWMDDDNKNLQKHKRRKDVRTKEEEKEAENWAVAFNSMCKEIEDFPLEIE
ncbi:hypothetical protein BDFB_004913 [Asbolus verrucosus]|uniref:Uncharacterized protein n=1 Tax=Asbolus verrucosus TaxID=1661398 RepID=A0A482WAG3_ASBVE|nr:hypothetical protein BDFB_004913 [Asbolus verrucosus]